ncbi:MAG: hypothetical protein HQL27_03870 [Candidatus Omnitrophica bacterium]|nr:hypothetical protein [Candidatus Omnitrophota bacterium]
MFTKKQIIEKIEKLIKDEENAIPFYSKNIDDSFFFRGFTPERINQIKTTLRSLSEDCQRHKEYFEKLIADIQKEDKDVY